MTTIVFVALFSVWAAFFGYSAGRAQGRRDAEAELGTIWMTASQRHPDYDVIDLTKDSEGEALPEGWPAAGSYWLSPGDKP